MSFDRYKNCPLNKLIDIQREYIARMNLILNKNITNEEFQIRLKEYDEYTEWLDRHIKELK